MAVTYVPRIFGGTLIIIHPQPGIATLSDSLHGQATLSDVRIDIASVSDVKVGDAALSDQG